MEKIIKLKALLKKEKVDGYLIPKNDEFFSEYTTKHFDRLNYITNFSGSSGFSLVLKDKKYLFVDGRYTLQANDQSGKIFKVMTIPKQMPKKILKNKNYIIGFDPKLYTKKTFKIFFNNSDCKFKPIEKNLIDQIWKRKIKKNYNKFYTLPKNSIGENFQEKIKKVSSYLKKKDADFILITASENAAWLLNIRGRDSKYSPIPNCYVLISKDKKISFFCDLRKMSLSLKKYLNKIKVKEIIHTGTILSQIKDKKFIVDRNTCSIYFEKLILKNNKILDFVDPIYSLKAIKNKIEIENTKKVHIYDGVALTKFLFWIKKNIKKRKITELSAARKLFQLRKKNKKFKFLSFPTISGTGSNGAIIHYNPTKITNKVLNGGDVYLVDSGGQYEYGTTDVTRTISLNRVNKRIKNIFTRVLKGHIAVSNFKLKKNSTGSIIDSKARKYLKQIGLNYSHGTGHGVGYFLNVHEGPQAISKNNKIRFEEGMILSNEPGYYEKNKFGIRIENLIYVKRKKNKNYFENLTLVPIDKDLINPNLLSKIEKNWLDVYHDKVFNVLKSFMNTTEIKDLKKACSTI